MLLTRNQEGAVVHDRVSADVHVREGADAPLSHEGTDTVDCRTRERTARP